MKKNSIAQLIGQSVSLIGITFLMTTLFIGCGEIKKLDNVNKNTGEMNQTTKGLDEKMKELLDVAKEDLTGRMTDLEGNMAELFDSMRQGDGSNLRRGAFEKLQQQRSLQGRVAEAGLYMQSFEFQVMGNVAIDQQSGRREVLYQQALLEFFLKLDDLALPNGLVIPDAEPDIKDPESEKSRASAFNAMAFTLHKVNRKQAADPVYGRPLSFYDLIMNALYAKADIDNGQLVLPEGPHYMKEVLVRPDRVRQLLQARYNMFFYALIGLTTNLTEQSTLGRVFSLIDGIEIDLSEKKLGTAGLSYILEEILRPAAQTARDMKVLGIVPERNIKTKLLLRNVTILPHAKSAASGVEMTPLEQEALSLWAAYQ